MILDILAWILAAIPAVLLAVLGIELLLGVLTSDRRAPAAAGSHPRAAILMPAHNEAGGIAQTLARLRPALDEHIRLVVIADNCSDETARIARAALPEALVIERHDSSQRGKGHALAFGREALRADPPDCVVVLDADCEISPGDLRLLIEAAAASGRPVQSCYLLRSRAEDRPMTQISNFAFLIKNLIRQRGATAIGAPAILGGTGMAFPWGLIAQAPLATSHLVEDLVLGIDYARKGQAPLYLGQARTWSAAASQQDTLTQRTRWEHGYIQTALRHGLPLALGSLARGRLSLAWFGLSLMVPPLALLMALSLAVLVATALLALLGASAAPALLLLGLLALVALLLVLAWLRDGREMVSAATLARIPVYILWKIPVYLRLVKKRETEWVRTKRAGEE
ncbi:MAG: glycosyltransferase [Sphingomonadales bacterium]|nr:glycosyltransferase [Sphingomonadales bacterium]